MKPPPTSSEIRDQMWLTPPFGQELRWPNLRLIAVDCSHVDFARRRAAATNANRPASQNHKAGQPSLRAIRTNLRSFVAEPCFDQLVARNLNFGVTQTELRRTNRAIRRAAPRSQLGRPPVLEPLLALSSGFGTA